MLLKRWREKYKEKEPQELKVYFSGEWEAEMGRGEITTWDIKWYTHIDFKKEKNKRAFAQKGGEWGGQGRRKNPAILISRIWGFKEIEETQQRLSCVARCSSSSCFFLPRVRKQCFHCGNNGTLKVGDLTKELAGNVWLARRWEYL